MNKMELIRALQKKSGITKYEAGEVVQAFFGEMADALANGERVEIRGVCSFYVKHYDSYVGRNPKTGVKVQIPEKRLPFFKPGKELRDRVNSKKKR